MKNQVCTIIGIVGGAIATAFGGWDTALAALVTFMAIDYITGLMVAGIFHTSPKTESGALESLAGWKGLCRKGVTLLVVLVACQLDKVMGSSFIRDAAIIGFMANEAISIIENAGLMGVPIPETITQAVDVLYGDNVIEKHGINRDSTGDREKTRYLCGKQGIFTRDRALIRPGFIRQLETRASTRSASFFHALGSPGRPHNGGGEAGAYRTRNGAKPLKQGHLRAKRGPLGPSRKSQQQTKRTGFAAHGHSIAETAPEGKRASCANGALIRA